MTAIVRRNPDIQVLVGGDEGASYGQVYGALALLQAAGVSKVGLMSDPAELGYGAAEETQLRPGRGKRARDYAAVESTRGLLRRTSMPSLRIFS